MCTSPTPVPAPAPAPVYVPALARSAWLWFINSSTAYLSNSLSGLSSNITTGQASLTSQSSPLPLPLPQSPSPSTSPQQPLTFQCALCTLTGLWTFFWGRLYFAQISTVNIQKAFPCPLCACTRRTLKELKTRGCECVQRGAEGVALLKLAYGWTGDLKVIVKMLKRKKNRKVFDKNKLGYGRRGTMHSEGVWYLKV